MKKKYMLLIATLAVLAVLGLTTSFSKLISGTVVDAETGKPVEGAVVLAEWTRRQGIGDYHTVSVRAAYAITDTEGKFNIFGPLHPFVEAPDVTVYKKGYVAWNNKFIFPDYAHRKQSEDMYKQIRIERFKKFFSHKSHVRFIRNSINNEIAYSKKAKFRNAFTWEVDFDD
jgi:hypothetical protein